MAFTWNGDQYKTALKGASVTGLNKAAERLKAVSVPLAPIDRGPLRESVQIYEASAGNLEAAVSYNTPYAVIQHEAVGYHHSEGQAKFLEQPAAEHADEFSGIIAKEIGGISG